MAETFDFSMYWMRLLLHRYINIYVHRTSSSSISYWICCFPFYSANAGAKKSQPSKWKCRMKRTSQFRQMYFSLYIVKCAINIEDFSKLLPLRSRQIEWDFTSINNWNAKKTFTQNVRSTKISNDKSSANQLEKPLHQLIKINSGDCKCKQFDLNPLNSVWMKVIDE